MNKIILLSAFLYGVVVGCDHPCKDRYVKPVFIGYSLPDIDTLVFKKYKPGENFLTLVDSIVITNNGASAFYTIPGDTVIVEPTVICCQYDIMKPGFDWKIYIPAKNKTVSISAIASPQTETTCWKCSCWNSIDSYRQDGQLILTTYTDGNYDYTSGYFAYIRN